MGERNRVRERKNNMGMGRERARERERETKEKLTALKLRTNPLALLASEAAWRHQCFKSRTVDQQAQPTAFWAASFQVSAKMQSSLQQKHKSRSAHAQCSNFCSVQWFHGDMRRFQTTGPCNQMGKRPWQWVT